MAEKEAAEAEAAAASEKREAAEARAAEEAAKRAGAEAKRLAAAHEKEAAEAAQARAAAAAAGERAAKEHKEAEEAARKRKLAQSRRTRTLALPFGLPRAPPLSLPLPLPLPLPQVRQGEGGGPRGRAPRRQGQPPGDADQVLRRRLPLPRPHARRRPVSGDRPLTERRSSRSRCAVGAVAGGGRGGDGGACHRCPCRGVREVSGDVGVGPGGGTRERGPGDTGTGWVGLRGLWESRTRGGRVGWAGAGRAGGWGLSQRSGICGKQSRGTKMPRASVFACCRLVAGVAWAHGIMGRRAGCTCDMGARRF